MTFILGHDKILERPIAEVASLVAFLYTHGKFDSLRRLRLMLVKEQLDAVSTVRTLPRSHIKQLKARIIGINWRLGVDLGRCEDEMDRLQLLSIRFWDGCCVVNTLPCNHLNQKED